MDKLRNDFLSALREAIQRAGSQTELAKASGMQQSRISDYLSERYELENITVGTLRKIFPDLQMQYFPARPKVESSTDQELEKRIVNHFRSLSPADKARYAMLVAANFPDNLREEIK